jgi:hypothetical protein
MKMETLYNMTTKGEIDQLFENRIRKIFKPVDPDPSYVQKLKKSLLDKTEIYLEKDNPSIFLLLIIVGLILAILVFLVINKIMGK